MDLQLLVAVNLMSLSGLAVLVILMHRPQGFASWLLAHAVVVVSGAAALLWLPRWSGAVVTGAFVPLILAPYLLFFIAQRRGLMNRKQEAAFYWRLVTCFHPAAQMRLAAAIAKARSRPTIDEEVVALQELAERATPANQTLLQIYAARAQDDWQAVLECAQRHVGRPSELAALEIRAFGETGRPNDMVRAYAAAKSKLVGVNRSLSQLFILAFCGRRESVGRLLDNQLSALAPEAKEYWTAIASKVAGTDDAWRRLFSGCASAAEDTTSRRAARRHLATPRAPLALTAESLATIEATEDWLRQRPQRRMFAVRYFPVTATLMVLIAAAFALEWARGGPANTRVLIELGALWPPLILQKGEWWRLATALFLHQNWLHVGSNLFLLYVFGWLCETSLGSIRTLVIYVVGGLASSATVLWLMSTGTIQFGVFLGASGAVFALVGAEVVRRSINWLRSRDTLDLNAVVILAGALLVEVAVDLNFPQISFAAHAAGFVTGAALGLGLLAVKRMLDAGGVSSPVDPDRDSSSARSF